MRFPRILGLTKRANADASPVPAMVNGGEVVPGAPWAAEPGVREIRHMGYSMKHRGDGKAGGRDVLSGGLLWVAGVVIAAALGGAAYVAYEAQRLFSLAHN